MKWTVLLDNSGEHDLWGVAVPWLGVATQGETREEALEMARDLIALTLEDMLGKGQVIDEDEYLPTLAVVEVDTPTAEAALHTLQQEMAFVEANAPITIAAAAEHFGLTVFALRRAIRVKRLYSRRIGHLRVVNPLNVARYLADLAERREHSDPVA